MGYGMPIVTQSGGGINTDSGVKTPLLERVNAESVAAIFDGSRNLGTDLAKTFGFDAALFAPLTTFDDILASEPAMNVLADSPPAMKAILAWDGGTRFFLEGEYAAGNALYSITGKVLPPDEATIQKLVTLQKLNDILVNGEEWNADSFLATLASDNFPGIYMERIYELFLLNIKIFLKIIRTENCRYSQLSIHSQYKDKINKFRDRLYRMCKKYNGDKFSGVTIPAHSGSGTTGNRIIYYYNGGWATNSNNFGANKMIIFPTLIHATQNDASQSNYSVPYLYAWDAVSTNILYQQYPTMTSGTVYSPIDFNGFILGSIAKRNITTGVMGPAGTANAVYGEAFSDNGQ